MLIAIKKDGSYNRDFGDKFYFTFETPFTESNIYVERTQISDRMGTAISGYFMPLIGMSIKHDEGIELINTYLNSLETLKAKRSKKKIGFQIEFLIQKIFRA